MSNQIFSSPGSFHSACKQAEYLVYLSDLLFFFNRGDKGRQGVLSGTFVIYRMNIAQR